MSKAKKILVINDMLSKEVHQRRKEILEELKGLNAQGYNIMMMRRRTFKQKYYILQHTDVWRNAKALNIQYALFSSNFKCSECDGFLNFQKCTMHHNKYKPNELFTPQFIDFTHNLCHKKIHK